MLPKRVLLGVAYSLMRATVRPQPQFILSRASEAQELAQEVLRRVASRWLGSGPCHRLAPCLVFALGFAASLCFWQSFHARSHWSFPHQTVSACVVTAAVLDTYKDN